MRKQIKAAVIGAGNMGTALIQGLLRAGFSASSILVREVDKARLHAVVKEFRIKPAAELASSLSADAAVVAVKPQSLPSLLEEMAAVGRPFPLLISMVAGVPVRRFKERLGEKARVVRVMPNTPALIGEGVSAWFAGPGCQQRDKRLAAEIISCLGPAHEVKEEGLLDAVTGLSGSGPAYVYVMIEALADAGVKMGLSRPLAQELAARTVAGAARMVTQTGEHPASLKDKVASPGGTTIAGLSELERAGFRAALINAVEAATRRARELGE